MDIMFIEDNRLHISSDFAFYLSRLSNYNRRGCGRGRRDDDNPGYNQSPLIKKWVMRGGIVCFCTTDDEPEGASE